MARAATGAVLRVRVQPRAAKSEVLGWRDGALAVRLTAAPVEGAANRACGQLLASTLGVRRSHVTLATGEKSRDKAWRIEGLTETEIAARLALAGFPAEE